MTRTLWKCDKTGETFEVYRLVYGYGEFILHARNGDLAYWNALDDIAFDEIVKIVAEAVEKWGLRKGKVMGVLYGLCCERAPDGSVYRTVPYCPICRDDNVSFEIMPEPPQLKTFRLPQVTHKHWRGLTQAQREALAENELKLAGLI